MNSAESVVAPLPPRKRRRTVIGVVARVSGAKTIRVVLTREFKHPRYEKRTRRRSVYMAHDEKGDAKVGDTVMLRQTRRFSKTKSWLLIEVVKRAGAEHAPSTPATESVP